MAKRSLALKTLASVGVVVVLNLMSVVPALATTDTEQQNPDLTVSVSLASSGADPDVAAVGDTVTAALSVTNNTRQFQRVEVKLTLVIPGGQSFDASLSIFLAPFQTLARSITFTVSEVLPKGQYDVTLEASNSRGTSSATASITVI